MAVIRLVVVWFAVVWVWWTLFVCCDFVVVWCWIVVSLVWLIVLWLVFLFTLILFVCLVLRFGLLVWFIWLALWFLCSGYFVGVWWLFNCVSFLGCLCNGGSVLIYFRLFCFWLDCSLVLLFSVVCGVLW